MPSEVLIVDVEKGALAASQGRNREGGDGSFGEPLVYKDDGPLTPDQVHDSRLRYGMNTLASEKKTSWYTKLLEALLHPFNILLFIIAVISLISNETTTTIIISIMVFVSTVLRFQQEWKNEGALHSLLKLINKAVSVIRVDPQEGLTREMNIPAEELVPGDLVVLRPGELVPADAIVLTSKVFFVSQAPLTGEAIPVEKFNEDETNRPGLLGLTEDEKAEKRRINEAREKRISAHRRMSTPKRFFRIICGLSVKMESQLDTKGFELKEDLTSSSHVFMGTQVITGMATARVTRTAHRTLFGQMAEVLSRSQPTNPFQQGVRRISWIFFLTMFLMIPPICLIRIYYKHENWTNMFVFALSISVGLTPEMLPMIVNGNLARGSIQLTKKFGIAKKLDAIINLGAMDVLCTDKTGTLTKSVVQLNNHLSPYGSTSYFPLRIGFLNSYFQSVLQNPLDTAITTYYDKITQPPDEHAEKSETDNNIADVGSKGDIIATDGTRLLEPEAFVHLYSRVDEVPFDFVRRRLSVILKEVNEDGQEAVYLVCKGAVEEIISVCTKVVIENPKKGENVFPSASDVISMKDDMKARFQSEYEKFTEQGQRLLGVAFKQMPNTTTQASADDESELVFLGFLAFTDPPKESAKEAIQELIRHNIEIKVLTGDSPNICAAVCHELHLPVKKVVTADELMEAKEIGPVRVREVIRRGTIFAKLTPLQKLFIVQKLKEMKHVVGFMGDGINDAPALKEADVGISVENGIDICRESADIILLDKDLSVIVNAIRIGRKTYGNTIKYIAMAVSSNFGNVFSVLVASIWLPYQPMKSTHLLVQNLLYDFSQIAIPWDSVDEDFLTVPHKWNIASILRFMLWMGPWSSIFDITTFAFMYHYYKIQDPEEKDPENVKFFQTAWFTVGLLTQTLIVHMIRTTKIPIVQSRASKSMTFTTLAVMIIGASLPYIPKVNEALGFYTKLYDKTMFYFFLAAVLAGYCLAANIAKFIYIAIFKEWF